jgi:hypothetical protein
MPIEPRAREWWRGLQWKNRTERAIPPRSVSSQSDCRRPSTSVANRVASSRSAHSITTCPKPWPSVRNPSGTSGEWNGVGASCSPSTISTGTPQGASIRASRATRRAAASAGVPSVTGAPAAWARATTSSKAPAVGASKAKNTASLAGPWRTSRRWAFASFRHVTQPSAVGSPGTSPATSARKAPKASTSDTSTPR